MYSISNLCSTSYNTRYVNYRLWRSVENAGGAWESPPLPRGGRWDVSDEGFARWRNMGDDRSPPKWPRMRFAPAEPMRIPPTCRIARPARFSEAGFAEDGRKTLLRMTASAFGRRFPPSAPLERASAAKVRRPCTSCVDRGSRRCMSRCNPRRKIAEVRQRGVPGGLRGWLRIAGHPRPTCVIFALQKRRIVGGERIGRCSPPPCRGRADSANSETERMNSPQRRHEVHLRGLPRRLLLHGPHHRHPEGAAARSRSCRSHGGDRRILPAELEAGFRA